MELNALATAATENDPRGANQSSGGVSKPPKAAKKKGESDNKKRIKSQAFKADKLVQILHNNSVSGIITRKGRLTSTETGP